MAASDFENRPERTRKAIEPFLAMGPCPLCHGARLSQAALGCKIGGYNIAELSSMEVSELIDVIKAIQKDSLAAGILTTVTARLQNMIDIGLGYLSLERETDTPLRRRIGARETGQAPERQPGGCDVHLRRTQRRAAPARRAPLERAAAKTARQGQHRPGGGT